LEAKTIFRRIPPPAGVGQGVGTVVSTKGGQDGISLKPNVLGWTGTITTRQGTPDLRAGLMGGAVGCIGTGTGGTELGTKKNKSNRINTADNASVLSTIPSS